MKIFFLVICMLSPLFLSISQQKSHHKPISLILDVTFEIKYDGDSYKAIYLRVFSDGLREYEIFGKGSQRNVNSQEREIKAKIIRNKMKKDDLIKLKEILYSEAVKDINNEYPPAIPSIDSSETIGVKIFNEEKEIKSIKIMNFFPTQKRIKGKPYPLYPASLLTLLCSIEKMRKREPMRLFEDSASLCIDEKVN